MKLTPAVRSVALAAAALVVGAVGVGLVGHAPRSYAEVTNLNPVRVPVDGHAANSGFLVFIEQNVNLEGNEAEGTMAMGGDLTINGTYNVAAGAPPVYEMPTADGDSGPIYLYVGGGVDLSDAGTVFVENQGFTKIADTGTYDAYNVDNNGADVNYRVVDEGEPYNTSGGFIDGRTHGQTPASIETPAAALLDVEEAFTAYRQVTQDLAACASTVALTDAQGNPLDVITPGAQGFLTLEEGVTNVLELSTAELANLSEIVFRNEPTQDTPLLVNVTGGAFVGDSPNTAGISGTQAPYTLWNFPDAATVTVNGGATAEGTLYAPNADLQWLSASNIEGNVIAANFSHGGTTTEAGEIHDFPFQTELTCTDGPSPTTTTPPTTTTTTTTTEPTTTEPTTTEPTSTEPTSTEPTTTGPASSTVPPVTFTRTSPLSPGVALGGSDGDGLADTGGGPLGWLILGGAAALAAGAALVAGGAIRARRKTD